MILCEIKIDGVWKYISNQDVMLSDSSTPYDAYVAAFPSLQFGINTDWGGLVSKSFGGIQVKTAPFSAIPPLSAEIKLYHTATTYAAKTLLFEGYAHRKSPAPDVTEFDLYPYPDTATVKSHLYSDTLTNIASSIATTLSLTYDGTMAQSPSPTVEYTTPASDNLVLDELGKMAAFFDHFVWSNDGILYLIHNDADNTTSEVPFVHDVRYHDLVPPKKVSEATLAQEITTAYTYGREVHISPTCTNVAATALAAVTAIKDRLIMPWFDITVMLDDLPAVKFGEKITWTDPDSRTVGINSSFPFDLTGEMRVRKIAYAMDDGQIVLSGEGALS